MGLQTTPPRFRVWDDERGRFCTRNGSIEFSVTDLVVYARDNELTLQDYYQTEDGTLKPKFIISHDTGLKDKNGESIYTGDIVKIPHNDGTVNVQVVYDHGASYVYRPGLYKTTPYLLLIVCCSEAEKIGNIWQDEERLLA